MFGGKALPDVEPVDPAIELPVEHPPTYPDPPPPPPSAYPGLTPLPPP